MGKSGFIYACTRQNERHSVKTGHTTQDCPQEYMQNEFSRTLYPLEVLACQSTCEALLSERLVQHYLHKYILSDSHELFDLRSGVHELEAGFKLVRDIDDHSGKAKPADPISREEFLANRVLNKEKKKKALYAKQESQKEVQAELKKEKVLKKKLAKEKARDEEGEAKAEAKAERQSFIGEKMQLFISDRCLKGQKLKETTVSLLQAFNEWSEVKITPNELSYQMSESGFKKATARLPDLDKPVLCYHGMQVQHCEDLTVSDLQII